MRMETLAVCPACDGAVLADLYRYNDLRYLGRAVDRKLARSNFVLCRSCGLMFARRRQAIEAFSDYYTHFAEWESRTYAVYPPPEKFVRAKIDAAVDIARVLVEHDLLRPGARVLHIRADGGALMAHLRDHHGVTDVYGLEIFDTSRRFAREHYGLENVAPLLYGDFAIPFAPVRFDLIVSNHLLTHACRPRGAFAAVRDRLSADGAVFLYNEPNHMLGFTRTGAPFLRHGINNFHKQLFTEETLLTLLRLGGAQGTVVGQRKMSPLVIARPAAALHPSDLPVKDFTPSLEAFRSWVKRHEHERKVATWRRRRKRILALVPAGLRRMGRRLGGAAPNP